MTSTTKNKVKFGGISFPAVGVLGSGDVNVTYAPDNSVVSIILLPLSINLQKSSDGLLKLAVLTLEAPAAATSAGRSFTYRCIVKGSISKTANGRAYGLLLVAGETKALDFKYGRALSGQEISTAVTGGRKVSVSEGAPLPPSTLTIVIAGERRTSGDAVLFQIDSVDLTGSTSK